MYMCILVLKYVYMVYHTYQVYRYITYEYMQCEQGRKVLDSKTLEI